MVMTEFEQQVCDEYGWGPVWLSFQEERAVSGGEELCQVESQPRSKQLQLV
jgi:hypothetical protein